MLVVKGKRRFQEDDGQRGAAGSGEGETEGAGAGAETRSGALGEGLQGRGMRRASLRRNIIHK